MDFITGSLNYYSCTTIFDEGIYNLAPLSAVVTAQEMLAKYAVPAAVGIGALSLLKKWISRTHLPWLRKTTSVTLPGTKRPFQSHFIQVNATNVSHLATNGILFVDAMTSTVLNVLGIGERLNILWQREEPITSDIRKMHFISFLAGVTACTLQRFSKPVEDPALRCGLLGCAIASLALCHLTLAVPFALQRKSKNLCEPLYLLEMIGCIIEFFRVHHTLAGILGSCSGMIVAGVGLITYFGTDCTAVVGEENRLYLVEQELFPHYIFLLIYAFLINSPSGSLLHWTTPNKNGLMISQIKDKAAKCLLHLGADINRRDIYGFPPIAYSAVQGDLKRVRLYLKYGVRLNEPDFNFIRELIFSQYYSRSYLSKNIVNKLVNYGTPVSSFEKTNSLMGAWLSLNFFYYRNNPLGMARAQAVFATLVQRGATFCGGFESPADENNAHAERNRHLTWSVRVSILEPELKGVFNERNILGLLHSFYG